MFFVINIIFYTVFLVKYGNCFREEFLAGPSVGRAIINGKEASIEWYPSIVGISHLWHQHCGGTIIGRDVVLTAAHCIHSRSISDLGICAGANYKNCRDGKTYSVKASIIHPEYNLELVDNDLGLLQVTEEFVLSETVKIARLVSAPVKHGSIVYAIGWGGGEYSEEKIQDIKLRVISKPECKQRLPYNTITESMLCTFNKKGRDTCDGDSGGPLFYQGQLVGVTSWGIKCGLWYPSIYSDVFYARKWIEESMRQFLKIDAYTSNFKSSEYSSSSSEDDDSKKLDATSQQPTLSATKVAEPISLKPTLAKHVDVISKSIEVDENSSSSSEEHNSSGSDKKSTRYKRTLSATNVADPITVKPIVKKNENAYESKSIDKDEDSSSSSEEDISSGSGKNSKIQQQTLSATNVAVPITFKPNAEKNENAYKSKSIDEDEDSSTSSEDSRSSDKNLANSQPTSSVANVAVPITLKPNNETKSIDVDENSSSSSEEDNRSGSGENSRSQQPTVEKNENADKSQSIDVGEDSSSSSEDSSSSDKNLTNPLPTSSAANVAVPITLKPTLEKNENANKSKSIDVYDNSSSSSEEDNRSDSGKNSRSQQQTLSASSVAVPITLKANNKTKSIDVDENSSSSSEEDNRSGSGENSRSQQPTVEKNENADKSQSIDVGEDSSSSSEDSSSSDKNLTNPLPTSSAANVAVPITLKPTLEKNENANKSKSIDVYDNSSSSSEEDNRSDSGENSRSQQQTLSASSVAVPITFKPNSDNNKDANETKSIKVDENSSSSSEEDNSSGSDKKSTNPPANLAVPITFKPNLENNKDAYKTKSINVDENSSSSSDEDNRSGSGENSRSQQPTLSATNVAVPITFKPTAKKIENANKSKSIDVDGDSSSSSEDSSSSDKNSANLEPTISAANVADLISFKHANNSKIVDVDKYSSSSSEYVD